ncbi:MAG: fused MFS/spermidine synthase, partial [Acidobacteriota bacterium]|nr:fused MFS/spermidine synthase [Acidobacteriota bacterium]
VGSILGTFLAGFVLIPFVGSEKTLYLIGASLIGLSILLAPFAISKVNVAVLVLFILGISANELKSYYLQQSKDLRDIDTEYSRVQIFKIIEPHTKKTIRVIAIDPFFVQSGTFLDSDDLVFDYNKYYHLLRLFKPDVKKSLMIGGAGYSFPKDYLMKYPNAEIKVVEIDPQMTEIAREFFRLKDNPRLKITHQDGRVFLNQAESNQYDAVLMDAFGSLFSVPFQLTTLEAAQHINRVLKEDGVVIFNLGGAIKGDAARFLQAELNTYRQVFPKVYLFKINADYTDEQLQNLIIVACKVKTAAIVASDDVEISNMLKHLYVEDINSDIEVLTDDLAPVEYYNSFAQRSFRRAK